MTLWLFALSQAALVVFGLPAAFIPSIRRLSWASRLASSYALGTILLALEGVLFSFVGWKWSYPGLAVPLLILSAGGIWLQRRLPAEPGVRGKVPAAVAVIACVVCAVAVLILYQGVISGRAMSVDLILFWGIKAARFAHAGGIDIPFMTWVYSTHAHANYPPLFPTTLSWFALGRPEGLWKAAPLSTVIWFAAAIPLVFDSLRSRMSGSAAAATTAFWSAALAAGLINAYSGGNAEAALIFFETAAISFLLFAPMETWKDGVAPGLFLAGAVFTKLEGTVATGFILSGAVLVLLIARQWRGWWMPLLVAAAIPLVVALTWMSFMLMFDIPLRDPTHLTATGIVFDHVEAIAAEEVLKSGFGTRGLSWILPLGVLIVFADRWNARLLLPMGFALALLAFTTFYYLVPRSDPSELIGWTFSRLMLPALSALILGASDLLFGPVANQARGSVSSSSHER